MPARYLHPCLPSLPSLPSPGFSRGSGTVALHSQGCCAGHSGAGAAVWGGLRCLRTRGSLWSWDMVADAAAVFGSSTTTRTPGIMDSITTQLDPRREWSSLCCSFNKDGIKKNIFF